MKEKIIKNGDCVCLGTELISAIIVGQLYGCYEVIGTTKKKRGIPKASQKFVILKNTKTNRVINVAPNQLEKLSKLSFSDADLRSRSFKSKCAFSELQAVEIYQEVLENSELPIELRKSMSELAAKYGVGVTTLYNLMSGKTYPVIRLIKTGKIKIDALLAHRRAESINEQIKTCIAILSAIKSTVIFTLRKLYKGDSLLVDKVNELKPYDVKTMPDATRYEILAYNKKQINNAANILVSIVKN